MWDEFELRSLKENLCDENSRLESQGWWRRIRWAPTLDDLDEGDEERDRECWKNIVVE